MIGKLPLFYVGMNKGLEFEISLSDLNINRHILDFIFRGDKVDFYPIVLTSNIDKAKQFWKLSESIPLGSLNSGEQVEQLLSKYAWTRDYVISQFEQVGINRPNLFGGLTYFLMNIGLGEKMRDLQLEIFNSRLDTLACEIKKMDPLYVLLQNEYC